MAENLICSKLSLLLYQTASGYISFKQRKGCLGFPGDADGKKSAYNMGDPDLIPGSEGSPGAGRSNPLQYCCLENSMDRGASQATIHWIAKSCCCFCEVASIVSDSLRLLGRQPTRLPRSLGFSRQEHWSGLPFPSPIHEMWKVKVKSLSRVLLLATPWTAAHQAPQSMGFSRQEYWSGLPLPSPCPSLKPRIKPRTPALQADSLQPQRPGKP